MAKEKTLDSRKFQLGRKDAQWAGVDYELPQQIVLMCKCIIIHLHLKVTNVSLFDVRAKILALLVSAPISKLYTAPLLGSWVVG